MEAELAAKQKDLSELQPPAEMLSPNELARITPSARAPSGPSSRPCAFPARAL